MARKEYRGKDGDILEAVDLRSTMLRNRDALAAVGNLKPGLSSTVAIIDPENVPVNDAFTRVQNHAIVLRSLTRP